MTPRDITHDLPLFGIQIRQRRTIIEQTRRDQAIARVEDRNEPGPNDRALAEVEERLRRLPIGAEITSDSLLPDLSRFGFSDPRAVGAIMKRALAAGWIRPTDRFRNSTRPGNHCAPRRIYRNAYAERGDK